MTFTNPIYLQQDNVLYLSESECKTLRLGASKFNEKYARSVEILVRRAKGFVNTCPSIFVME